jgi:hypothetical protein
LNFSKQPKEILAKFSVYNLEIYSNRISSCVTTTTIGTSKITAKTQEGTSFMHD